MKKEYIRPKVKSCVLDKMELLQSSYVSGGGQTDLPPEAKRVKFDMYESDNYDDLGINTKWR